MIKRPATTTSATRVVTLRELEKKQENRPTSLRLLAMTSMVTHD